MVNGAVPTHLEDFDAGTEADVVAFGLEGADADAYRALRHTMTARQVAQLEDARDQLLAQLRVPAFVRRLVAGRRHVPAWRRP